MNTQMLWLAQSWLGLLVDISIKACLLACCAAGILATTRVRNGNARHRVWTVVLLGMLALPVLVRPPIQIGDAIQLTPGQEVDLGELKTEAEPPRAVPGFG